MHIGWQWRPLSGQWNDAILEQHKKPSSHGLAPPAPSSVTSFHCGSGSEKPWRTLWPQQRRRRHKKRWTIYSRVSSYLVWRCTNKTHSLKRIPPIPTRVPVPFPPKHRGTKPKVIYMHCTSFHCINNSQTYNASRLHFSIASMAKVLGPLSPPSGRWGLTMGM